jgi:acetyl esterase/lipase
MGSAHGASGRLLPKLLPEARAVLDEGKHFPWDYVPAAFRDVSVKRAANRSL